MAAFMAGDDPASSTAAIIVAVFGDLASLFLIGSSARLFYRIWREHTVGDVNPYPYLAALFNCCVWVLFACAHDHSWPVFAINAFGAIAEFVYMVVFLKYADEANEHQSQWPLLTLVLELLMVGTIAALGYGLRIAADLFSYAGLISGVIRYAVSLYSAYTAYQAQDVEGMDVVMAVAMLVNSIFWLAYAVIINSVFVFLPSLVGLVSAGTQLAVYIKFKKD